MATDTTERGLERLICAGLAGYPCDPPAEGTVADPPAGYGGVGWSGGNLHDYDREYGFPVHSVLWQQSTVSCGPWPSHASTLVTPWNTLEVAMKPSRSDPVLDEIREVRHRISARFDHDPERLVAYYIELQRRYQDRLIEVEKSPKAIRQADNGELPDHADGER